MERTNDEKKLLEKLGIDNFRQLNTKHALELFSPFKDFLPEIQQKVLEQIPNVSNFMQSSIKENSALVKNVLDSNNEESKSVINSYDAILSSLQNRLDTDESLSYEQQMEIYDKMFIITDKKNEAHDKHNLFNEKMINKCFTYGTICITIIAGVMGINCNFNKKS